MNPDKVPGTFKQPEEPSEERAEFRQPVKRTIYRPLGIGAQRVGEETHVQLLITPFEFVILELDAESRAVLLRELAGGVVPATAADLPS